MAACKGLVRFSAPCATPRCMLEWSFTLEKNKLFYYRYYYFWDPWAASSHVQTAFRGSYRASMEYITARIAEGI